jgi:L-fucose isomerase-like protein
VTTRPAPFRAQDALQFLHDFGLQLACPAAPAVTRCLVDTERVERETEHGTVVVFTEVLKVKAGAFAAVAFGPGAPLVRATITDDAGTVHEYVVEGPVALGPSIFDAFALQPYRVRSSS